MGPENSGQYEFDFDAEDDSATNGKKGNVESRQVPESDAEKDQKSEEEIAHEDPFKFDDQTTGAGKPKDRSGWN